MTPTDSHLDPHLRERYGARRFGRRTWIVVAVVLGALGLGWLAWVAVFHSTPAASSELVAWEVVDDRSVTARVSVVRSDADVEASCLIRAQADDHTAVGESTFRVGPGGSASAVYRVEIRTARPATSVSLVGCLAEGQTRRR
ncbi:MAG: DUF4307 domain-containing protein [Nocardioides sp.]|nr:DUF4307 domain-containing protein [Nocardioides sp.]